MVQRILFFFCILLFLLPGTLQAQTKILQGVVKDNHSGETIPFASLSFKNSGNGRLSDSSGSYFFYLKPDFTDTLEITNVGYAPYKIFISYAALKTDTTNLTINLLAGKMNIGVVVKAKGNRGLFMWRQIVKKKPQNNRYRFDNFSYQLYNKLELDFKNVNKEKLSKLKLLRPFDFILDNIDTLEGVPFLPVYITESISDYYYQRNPLRRREVFKAVKTIGMDNESVTKLLGGMDQIVNIYNNFIPVFDKQFVSPISDNGDNYYNYKIADTQYVAGRRLIHFLFTAKRKGESTFEGDCWIHDSTYAVQKMNLRLSKEANINFVDQLSLIQEYSLVKDSVWFLSKDKFVVDISPFGKSKFSFIGKKTTTYQQVVLNDISVEEELNKNKVKEEVILPVEAKARDKEYWNINRPESLNKNEAGIYNMIDTLMQMPKFKAYTRAINFIGTGYLDVKQYQIGPWHNWVYSNAIEGLRLRFDINTNAKFSTKFNLHGYAAYGFKDGKLKGEFDVMYLAQRHPRMYFYASYFNDFDYGQNYFDEISADNIFALAIRKSGVPIKYIRSKEERLDFFKEWNPGISILLSTKHKDYNPIRNLPGETAYPTIKGFGFNTFEASLRLRFAYLERFLENTFSRISLGSPLPIAEIKYTKGINGVFGSGYNYHKLSGGVSNYSKIPPFGNIYYNLFAGKTYGTLPYLFLDIAPGNEIYYYNSSAFNMMNRYEFVHDEYVGFNFEHNFGNGLFRFIPLTRKLKFRQLWTAKGLLGNLSNANKALNFTGDYPFQSLNNKPYVELGTGVDNVFKVIRLDFIWRVTPTTLLINSKRFGLFVSFKLAF